VTLEHLARSFDLMKDAAASLDEKSFWAAWRMGHESLGRLMVEHQRQKSPSGSIAGEEVLGVIVHNGEHILFTRDAVYKTEEG
jgi:hypothetical protein